MEISHQSGRWGPFLLIPAIACAALPHHWATAHEGDRVVPILEITDDMLSQIDPRDGTTDEGPDLLGPPTLKTIDFKTDSESFSTEYDPSDFDFAIWLGWHEELDRIYFAGAFVDNVYWGTGHPPFATHGAQDKLSLGLDGDHSGPLTNGDFFDEGRYRLAMQFYMATPWISEGPTVIMTSDSLGFEQVFKPGSRVCYREGGQMVSDVEIIQPTIMEGNLMYQVEVPRRQGHRPTKRWISASNVEPSAIADAWEYGYWNSDTEEYEDPPAD